VIRSMWESRLESAAGPSHRCTVAKSEQLHRDNGTPLASGG
jgi:hypothetical protein